MKKIIVGIVIVSILAISGNYIVKGMKAAMDFRNAQIEMIHNN